MRCGIIKRLSTSAGNGTFIASNACQKQIHYANWSQNCTTHHADREPNNHGSNANTDGNGGNDGSDDAVQSGQRAAGVGDVVSEEREPKNRYVQRKNLGTRSAKGAKANDSSVGKIAPPKKSRVASKKKSQPE